MADQHSLRRRLLAVNAAIHAHGLNQGTSGNLSVRLEGGFIITPSALPHDQCGEDDLVFVAMDGQATGRHPPSSEWRLHRDILHAHPEANAVLHCHAPWATTLACLEREIPAFHYMVAVAGGDSIRCAPYALFGSQKLSDLAVAALRGRTACLLAHHGLVCTGASLDAVLNLSLEVEGLARIYSQALATGNVPLLSSIQMQRVLEQFSIYRQGRAGIAGERFGG